ncbi:type II toxin-antitoxin system VapC family toxin [Terrarubrum flagellatum]|uniref:type II toxin-antitoxin system VapC family toxin n=1 Tax=Terrirubrum flagellatum TaxID=2895980 RepID=UPI003144DD54
MIVVDASVLVEVLLRRADAPKIERLLFSGRVLHAPHLVDIEATQVIRRHVLMGEVDRARGREAINDLSDFPMRRHSHTSLLAPVWELRDNLTAYDAVYVALAKALDAPLLTRDRRLAAAAGHHARIELV